jgi:Tol biopolymer transport system component
MTMMRTWWKVRSWLAIAIVASASGSLVSCGKSYEAGRSSPAGSTSPTASPTSTAIPGVPSGSLLFLAYGNYESDIYRVNADGSGLAQLTDSPGGGFGAAWSPDGSQIAFSSSGAGNEPYSDVYVMKPDGSDLRNLTNARRWSGFISWSPDGSRILFNQNGIGPEDFWVMNTDGSNAVRIMAENRCWSDPDWSPDGSRILACQCESVERSDDCWLMVVDSDGANPRSIEGVRGPIRDPEWSPDGRRILYVVGRTGGQSSVYIVDREGGTPQKVYDGTIDWGDSSPPAWSPDGSCIAITTRPELMAISADGTERRTIVRASYFAWSPDGSRMAYLSRESSPQLYVVDVEGGTPVNVSGGAASLSAIPWSPDGRQLLFASGRNRQNGVYWMRPDGSKLEHVEEMSHGYVEPEDPGPAAIPGCRQGEYESDQGCLSPDGHLAASYAQREDGFWLTVRDVSGGTVDPVVNVGRSMCRSGNSLSWSLDGAYIYYIKGAIKGEGCAPGFLYRVRPDGTDEEQLTDLRVGALYGFAP